MWYIKSTHSGVRLSLAIGNRPCPAIKEKRNIRLEMVESGKCILNADSKLMDIVVDNFISNAVALSKDGGKVVVRMNDVGIEVSYIGRSFGITERKNMWRPLKRMGNFRNGEKVSEVSGLYFSGEILKLHGFEYGSYATDEGMIFYFNRKAKHYYRLHTD